MRLTYLILLVGVVLTLSNLFFSAPTMMMVLGLLIVGASLAILVYQTKNYRN